jgi:cyclic pyranopterin phosphate synthase
LVDAALKDSLGRAIKDLRISVTDRCNCRCTYCMPLNKYKWIDHREILSFEEIARIARLFLQIGVKKIRLTGGEPLLRHDLFKLIAQLTALPGLEDLCLTTNGSLLADQIDDLAAAGLRRINVSVDALDPEKYRRITRRNDLSKVLEGLLAAKRLGLSPVKINAVIERDINDGDILPLIEFARSNGFAVRFIEYMDAGNSNNWVSEKVVPKKEILETIHARYPIREKGRDGENAPAVCYEFVDGGGHVGIIASVTEPFCNGCTRTRLTADGKLVTCLFSDGEHDLRSLVRSNANDEEILAFISSIWRNRSDRYSDERMEAMHSPEGYRAKSRRKIEMIRLGG